MILLLLLLFFLLPIIIKHTHKPSVDNLPRKMGKKCQGRPHTLRPISKHISILFHHPPICRHSLFGHLPSTLPDTVLIIRTWCQLAICIINNGCLPSPPSSSSSAHVINVLLFASFSSSFSVPPPLLYFIILFFGVFLLLVLTHSIL